MKALSSLVISEHAANEYNDTESDVVTDDASVLRIITMEIRKMLELILLYLMK